MMMNLRNENDGSSIITVFDAKGKTFRSDIYSDYKANRPPMPDELRLQLDPIKSICKAIGFPIVEIEGVEASTPSISTIGNPIALHIDLIGSN